MLIAVSGLEVCTAPEAEEVYGVRLVRISAAVECYPYHQLTMTDPGPCICYYERKEDVINNDEEFGPYKSSQVIHIDLLVPF